MNNNQIISTLLLLFFLCPVFSLFATNDINPDGVPDGRYTISGHILDADNGEELLGATVFIKELSSGTATNLYGFYSLNLKPGRYTLSYSYIGYKTVEREITLKKDITINIELQTVSETLEAVEIQSQRKGEILKNAEMSSFKMDVKRIKQIPALMGEVDVIKAIQLLPGVQFASEGSTGFSVRGGNPDQNLILLDEATVYNASHLMGFFSVFNNDAVKDVKLYKGDIPASSGGRLSSLLDVRMKDGNSKKLSGTGGIGTISSRLTLEGPIMKDKISYIVSARRTYADIFLNFSSNEDLKDNTLYFYDLNGKINYKVDDNNRIFVSAYTGEDIFKNDDFGLGWGNQTITARWNHLLSKKLFSNYTYVFSKFSYHLGVPEGDANSFKWTARLRDHAIKADYGFYPNPNNTLRFGASLIFHRFHPGKAKGLGEDSFFSEYEVHHTNAIESGLYISNEQNIGSRIVLKYGLRYSVFNNIGSAVLYEFSNDFEVVDSAKYGSRELFNTFHGLEPRLGISFTLTEASTIKANYSRTRQYLHLASNSTAGTPLDVWIPSTPNVKPQIADQVAIGYFRNFRDNTIEASVEAYYKKVDNAIDFKDHAELLLNKEYEGELRFGQAESWGLEFLLKLVEGRLNGWISYTWSKSVRKFADINEGREYISPYDKPHDISIVLNYEISPRFSLGANWIYQSGRPVTFPTGGVWYQGVKIPVYSDRNSYRLPDYHRMDISLTYRGKEKPEKKWHGEWNLSLYNAYGRKNTWVINFEYGEDIENELYAEKTYLFGIVPAISYNFNF